MGTVVQVCIFSIEKLKVEYDDSFYFTYFILFYFIIYFIWFWSSRSTEYEVVEAQRKIWDVRRFKMK